MAWLLWTLCRFLVLCSSCVIFCLCSSVIPCWSGRVTYSMKYPIMIYNVCCVWTRYWCLLSQQSRRDTILCQTSRVCVSLPNKHYSILDVRYWPWVPIRLIGTVNMWYNFQIFITIAKMLMAFRMKQSGDSRHIGERTSTYFIFLLCLAQKSTLSHKFLDMSSPFYQFSDINL